MKSKTTLFIFALLNIFILSCKKSATRIIITTVKIEAKGKGSYTFLGEWNRKSNTSNTLSHDYIGNPTGNQINITSSWETSGDLENGEHWQFSFTENKNDPSASIEIKVYYNGKIHKTGTITGAKSNLSWQETI